METGFGEISSNLLKLSMTENSNESDYESETSGSATDGRADDSESNEDNEDTELGPSREKHSLSMPGSTAENDSEADETSNDIFDGSDSEDTSDTLSDGDSISENLTDIAISISNQANVLEKTPETVVTDRGGGDADQSHNDIDVFTVAEDGTSCATLKVKIVSKKRQHDPQAYQKWIQTKNEEIRRKCEKEKLRGQQLEEERRRQEEQRKEISKAKVQQWMQQKKQKASSEATPEPHMGTTSSSSQPFVQNDADARFKAWLQRVKQRDEEKKAKEALQHQREIETQHNKKKISREIYTKWSKSAKNKPRPVPMNQGLHTLKGTVSKIFVNPEPWKNNCD